MFIDLKKIPQGKDHLVTRVNSLSRVYLVGGCVRDLLLGRPPKDFDYLVTGSTPREMTSLGFKMVGAGFPVFLHPKNGDEYALARKEAKNGNGHCGFSFDFSPDVTLEEDLRRRDLTINAMALDEKTGEVFDFYGGLSDLNEKILRHVSPAFRDDPLRVLRVARFSSQFDGFMVSPSTASLMRSLAESGELSHLSGERIAREMSLALATKKPSVFFDCLKEVYALDKIFPEVANLFGVAQNMIHHPEGCVYTHTMMCLDHTARTNSSTAVRFAVLCHDFGKGLTAKHLLPAHHGHEEMGVDVVDSFAERLRVQRLWRELASSVTRLHLQFHRAGELSPGKIYKLLKTVRAERDQNFFDMFIKACQADAMGRGDVRDQAKRDAFRTSAEKKTLASEMILRRSLLAVQSIDLKSILERHAGKPSIGEIIMAEKILAVKNSKREQGDSTP